MTENENAGWAGDRYGLAKPDVPAGHQATLRPVEGSDVPQVSIEPVPDNPEPDMSEPTTKASVDAHTATQAEVAQAFAAEHDSQLQARQDAEVAAAGEPANIGTDGKPHFPLITEREKNDPSEPDHNPAECGTCGTEWPCEQAKEIERQQAEARGEQPVQVQQPDTPETP